MAPTLGNGKICYLEIPATDVAASAGFYQAVFGWKTRERADGSVAFDDGVGELSGTWLTGRKPMPPGVVIYIMVDDAKATVAKVTQHGGQVVQDIGAHHPEITALFRDPGGNVFGVYQQRD